MANATQALPDMSKATKANPVVVFVPLEQVKKLQSTLREVDTSRDEFKDQVLESIRDEGQLDAITIEAFGGPGQEKQHPVPFRLEEGPYAGELATTSPVLLQDGAHRIAAFEILQKQIAEGELDPSDCAVEDLNWIRCQYIGAVSELDRLLGQVQHNFNNVETKAPELAAQCGRILAANPHWTQADLAKKLHINRGKLSRLLRINRLPDFAKEVVDKGQVKGLNALELAAMPVECIDEDLVQRAKEDDTKTFKDYCSQVRQQHKAAQGKGKKKPGEFVPPTARVRKGREILDAWESEETQKELGLDKETLAWVVQQDTATIEQAKADWRTRQKTRIERKIKKHIQRATANFGIVFSDDEVKSSSPEELVAKTRASGKDTDGKIAAGLEQFIGDMRSGKIDLTKKKKKKKEEAKEE